MIETICWIVFFMGLGAITIVLVALAIVAISREDI
jgi:hypothetical protein